MSSHSQAVLGGGCFWCTESVFRALNGVSNVTSAYAGGHVPNPSYEDVCTGNTGHAEVIVIDFDPDKISYERILDVFFVTHDPTTLNRQGNDIGTQYRSVIFYADDAQKAAALSKIKALHAEDIPVVTELLPLPAVYPAEDYHQDFYARNPTQGYCNFSIPPKLAKLRKHFSESLK